MIIKKFDQTISPRNINKLYYFNFQGALFNKFLKSIIYSSVVFYIFSCALPFFSNIPLIILALGGFASVILLLKNKPKKFSLISTFFFLFILSFVVSAILSQNFERTFYLSFSMVPGLLLFFVIFENFENEGEYYLIYTGFVITSAIITIASLYAAFISDQPTPSHWVRQSELPYFIVPNDFMMLTVFMPFLVVMALRQTSRCLKFLLLFIIGINLLLFIVYRSRGAVLLSIIAIGFPLVLIKKITLKKLCLYIPFCIILLFIVDSLFAFSLIKKIFTIESWFSRLTPWMVAFEMFKIKPIFGTGPKTFGYFYPILVNKISNPDWIIVDNRLMPWAHNIYLETMAEQGFVGLMILLSLVGIIIIKIKQFFSCNKSKELIAITLSSTVILILGGMIEFSFIRHFFVIVFFSIIGVLATLS